MSSSLTASAEALNAVPYYASCLLGFLPQRHFVGFPLKTIHHSFDRVDEDFDDLASEGPELPRTTS